MVLTLVLVFGCSETPRITDSGVDHANMTLVQRPEFTDNRPAEVIQSFIMTAAVTYQTADKKPPPPPPDTGSEDPNPNPAHKYAYIVGISDYEGTANDLEYCDDDARDMKAYMQSQGFTVVMDLDGNATADAIEAGLTWLMTQAEPGDEIAFCYSGHGVKYANYGTCLISADLWYITHGFIMQFFNGADCSKKIMTIDACKAGGFLPDGEAGSFIATASTNGFSYDAPDLQNGAWTYYWLEGAGIYTYAEEIAPYAEDGMEDWAAQYNLRVSPSHSDKYAGMFDI
jgi:hypothetical protein